MTEPGQILYEDYEAENRNLQNCEIDSWEELRLIDKEIWSAVEIIWIERTATAISTIQ